jgi:hypothetical protein
MICWIKISILFSLPRGTGPVTGHLVQRQAAGTD